jgi:hypothetical protein
MLKVAEVEVRSCTTAGVRLMQPVAQTAARWLPAVRTGVLGGNLCYIMRQISVRTSLSFSQVLTSNEHCFTHLKDSVIEQQNTLPKQD